MCLSCVSLAAKDPTETTVLRNQFVVNMRKRFRTINSLINESLVVNDCFGLIGRANLETFTDNSFYQINYPVPLQANSLHGDDVSIQTESFMDWLEKAEEDVIFQRVGGAEIYLASYWFANYIHTAYKKGVIWARANLRNAYLREKDTDRAREFGYSAPEILIRISSDESVKNIDALLTRTLGDLRGITEAMNTSIRRSILDGLSFGWAPTAIAREIRDSVNDIGIYRASLLARTEIIRAHHISSIQEYREAGVVGVRVMAEFTTAGDSRVCPICASLDFQTTGKLWTLDRIESMIPVHPNCRCAALPVVTEEE